MKKAKILKEILESRRSIFPKNYTDEEIDENEVEENEYPLARHLSSYESAISILEKGFLLSRNELKKENQIIL